MQLWDIRHPEAAASGGPQVLFSTPEARGVLIHLAAAEEMGEHSVRERALLQVVSGSIEVTTAAGGAGAAAGAARDTTVCDERALMLLEPGEVRSVRALADTRLLLVLAPWPGEGHYDPAETADPHALPVNATVPRVR